MAEQSSSLSRFSLPRLFRFFWSSPTVTTWGSFAIASLKHLILLPLLLNRFSEGEIALWLLFSTFIAFSHHLDLGFYSSFSRLVSYVMGGATTLRGHTVRGQSKTTEGPNWDLMEKLHGSIGTIFLFIGAIALLLLGSIGSLSVARTISYGGDRPDLWCAWAVLVVSLAISIYGKRYRTVLHGMNEIPLLNRWNMLFNGLGVIFGASVILIFNSFLILVTTVQLFMVLAVFRDRYLLRQKVADRRFLAYPSLHWDRETIRAAWSPTWRTGIGIMASTGIVESTGVIYAQVARPELLVSYLLALRVMSVISNVSKAPFYSKLPVYARLRAEGKLDQLAGLTRRTMAYALYIFILGTAVIGLSADHLLLLIRSNATFVPLLFWLLMSNIWFLERHHAMHAQVYSTTNHIPFYIPISISGAINIALILLFIEPMQYWIFPMAHGISNLIINNWWNVKISLKSLNTGALSYLRGTFAYPVLVYLGIQLLIICTNANQLF